VLFRSLVDAFVDVLVLDDRVVVSIPMEDVFVEVLALVFAVVVFTNADIFVEVDVFVDDFAVTI